MDWWCPRQVSTVINFLLLTLGQALIKVSAERAMKGALETILTDIDIKIPLLRGEPSKVIEKTIRDSIIRRTGEKNRKKILEMSQLVRSVYDPVKAADKAPQRMQ
jgi:hypothetical protein